MPALLTVLPSDLALTGGGGERFAISLHRALLAELLGWRGIALTATSDPTRAPVPEGWVDATSRSPLRAHPQDAVSLRVLDGSLNDDVQVVIASQWQTLTTAWLRVRRKQATLVVIDYGGGSQAGSALARLPLPAADISAVYSDFQQQTSPVRSRHECRIRGGLDVDVFRTPVQEHRDIDFLLVGRFVPHKGQQEFIEALPEGARAYLVGPRGSYDPAYRDLVLDEAHARGVTVEMDCSNERLVSIYQRTRFIVQVPIASAQPVPELLGLTLLEGMACGCVPISAATGPSTEFVFPHLNGWTYEAGSVPDLHHTMARANEHETLRRRFSAAAAREAQDWTWTSAARTLLAAIRSSR